MAAPLLELVHARIDVDGVPAVDGLSLKTTGDRVVVLGTAKALFEAACGVRTPSHGEVQVCGAAARRAARERGVAGAPVEPRLPPKWTAREYITWSARISGQGRKEAAALTEQCVADLKMGASASERLSTASTETRRTVSIAAALATGAPAIFLEEPVSGLSDDVARHFARIVLRALERRSWIVFSARLPLVSPFAMDAEEAVIVAGSRVLAQGAPAELAAHERTFAVRVLGHAEDFARLATERGARVQGNGNNLTIDLGETLMVSDLLRAAMETDATVLELEPLADAFA